MIEKVPPQPLAAEDIMPTQIVSSPVRGHQMQQKTATISSAKIATVVGDDGAAIQQLIGSVVATTFLSANDATIMMWWQSLRTT